MEDQEPKIPVLISLDMMKDALKTLPIEEIRAVKEIIDEVLEEYDKDRAE
jgi:hypothetical protein